MAFRLGALLLAAAIIPHLVFCSTHDEPQRSVNHRHVSRQKHKMIKRSPGGPNSFSQGNPGSQDLNPNSDRPTLPSLRELLNPDYSQPHSQPHSQQAPSSLNEVPPSRYPLRFPGVEGLLAGFKPPDGDASFQHPNALACSQDPAHPESGNPPPPVTDPDAQQQFQPPKDARINQPPNPLHGSSSTSEVAITQAQFTNVVERIQQLDDEDRKQLAHALYCVTKFVHGGFFLEEDLVSAVANAKFYDDIGVLWEKTKSNPSTEIRYRENSADWDLHMNMAGFCRLYSDMRLHKGRRRQSVLLSAKRLYDRILLCIAEPNAAVYKKTIIKLLSSESLSS